MDLGLRQRAPHRGAPRPHHPPCLYPGDERRELGSGIGGISDNGGMEGCRQCSSGGQRSSCASAAAGNPAVRVPALRRPSRAARFRAGAAEFRGRAAEVFGNTGFRRAPDAGRLRPRPAPARCGRRGRACAARASGPCAAHARYRSGARASAEQVVTEEGRPRRDPPQNRQTASIGKKPAPPQPDAKTTATNPYSIDDPKSDRLLTFKLDQLSGAGQWI